MRKPLSIAIACIVIGILLLVFVHRPKTPDNSVIIVLSPHYDDASLSLGGLLAKHEHPTIVASFFTGVPPTPTTTPWDTTSGFKNSDEALSSRIQENNNSLHALGVDSIENYGYLDNQYRTDSGNNPELEQEITKDIQALIASEGTKTIAVYGPSIFTPDITHPDHGMLHRAYVNVMAQYPNKNVTFYFYEDYPYIARFNKEQPITLEKNLENDTNRLFDRVDIPLSNTEVRQKQKSLEAYTSQIKAFDALQFDVVTSDIDYTDARCGPGNACEVVYKLFIAP